MFLTMMRKPPPSTLERDAGRFLDSHRGRRAIRPAPPVGRAAERVLKPLAKRFGLGVEQLREHWAEIVGERVAKWSEPQAIQRQSGINVLVIRARGPAGAVVQAQSARILERVRQYAGQQAPTRLRVVQGASRAAQTDKKHVTAPQSTSQVSETVETSAEARLLSALDRFDKSVKNRTRN